MKHKRRQPQSDLSKQSDRRVLSERTDSLEFARARERALFVYTLLFAVCNIRLTSEMKRKTGAQEFPLKARVRD